MDPSSLDPNMGFTSIGIYLEVASDTENTGYDGNTNWGVKSFDVSGLQELQPIPEPSTYALIFGISSLVFTVFVRRKRR